MKWTEHAIRDRVMSPIRSCFTFLRSLPIFRSSTEGKIEMNQTVANEIFDDKKFIVDDVLWSKDPYREAYFVFEETLFCNQLKLKLVGSANLSAASVSFTIVHPNEGRVYGLDHGSDGHKNLRGIGNVGSLHKHKWKPEDPNWAYAPDDITAEATDIKNVWKQFCVEANICHFGDFFEPRG